MKNQISLLFILLFLTGIQNTFGQVESVGSSDYGRIFDITYDPAVENKLYAVSLYNHILVSDDNGESWDVLFSLATQEVTSFKQLKLTHNNNALSFIKYNESSNNNTLMLLDLDSNSVIDELEIPYNTSDRYIQAYDIYPNDPNIILMHARMDYGDTQHTYYTTNGGQDWELVYNKADYDNVAISSVAINPNNPDHLLLSRGLGPTAIDGGLFQSTDGGETWIQQLEGVVLDPIVFNPHNPNDIFIGTGIDFSGGRENVYRSTDGGENWLEMPIDWTPEQLDNIVHIAFHPTRTEKIIILEENEIVISNDNGATWESQVYDTNDVHGYYYGNHLSFNPFNDDELFINSDYHPLVSTDGGTTLSWAKNNLFRSTGSLVYDSQEGGHLYYGVQYGYVHKNLTSGEETTFEILPLGGYSQGNAPTLFKDKYASGRVYYFSNGWFGSSLEISSDYGQNFQQIFNTPMSYVNAIVTDPFNTNIIWVSLSDTMGATELKKVDVSDSNNIVITPISLPNSGVVNGIAFDAEKESQVTIAVGVNIYRTIDSGTSWTLSNEGLEQLDPKQDLILDLTTNPINKQQLTLATNKGIFTSLDGGQSWEQIYDALVHEIYHSPQTNGHMVGTIHTTQISEASIVFSKDAGDSWEQVENEKLLQTGSSATTAIFQEESAHVYVGSMDLGLLKYTVDLSTLGVERNIDNTFSIDVYPNPTTSTIMLNTNTLQVNEVSIWNVTGQRLLTSKNTDVIDVSSFSSGVYILKITTNNGTVITKKVIKK